MIGTLPWAGDPNYSMRADFNIVCRGPVRLVHNRARMEGYVERLDALGYETTIMPGISEQAFRDAVTDVFDFPGQFGYGPWTGDLDALDDGFLGLQVDPGKGRCLVIDRFDLAWQDNPKQLMGFCDLFAHRAWSYLMSGKVLILLLQSDNPHLETNKTGHRLDRVGSHSIAWVDEEWSHAARGI